MQVSDLARAKVNPVSRLRVEGSIQNNPIRRSRGISPHKRPSLQQVPRFGVPVHLPAPSMSAAGQRCSESVRADAEHAADTASFPPFERERLV